MSGSVATATASTTPVSVPKTMRALVENGGLLQWPTRIIRLAGVLPSLTSGPSASVQEIPVPDLEENDVLVKVDYAALNPKDWKQVDYLSPTGAIIGCDFSGTVVKLGSDNAKKWKIGDRVAGIVHGNKFDTKGCFAEYARAESDLIWSVPDDMSLEDAVSYTTPWVTALQVLIFSQGYGWPPKTVDGDQWYLIYGASSSVGLFTIQVAKMLGFKVAAICSPHNYTLVQSYGADAVFDYHDGVGIGPAIRKATNGGVTVGFDTISEGDSFDIALSGFKEDTEGRLNCVLFPKKERLPARPKVEIKMTLALTLFGKAFVFTPFKKYPANPDARRFFAEVNAKIPQIVQTYKIKTNPLDVRTGLDNIMQGLDEMRRGKVSGKKLVYKITA